MALFKELIYWDVKTPFLPFCWLLALLAPIDFKKNHNLDFVRPLQVLDTAFHMNEIELLQFFSQSFLYNICPLLITYTFVCDFIPVWLCALSFPVTVSLFYMFYFFSHECDDVVCLFVVVSLHFSYYLAFSWYALLSYPVLELLCLFPLIYPSLVFSFGTLACC